MYIKQVLEACDTLYPNPYTEAEKYFWCDELSELLAIKYKTQYTKSEIFETDGKYFLPDGVSASMLEKIICADKVINKQDFGELGIFCADTKDGCEITLPPSERYKRVYAVYILPHERIRNVSFEGTAVFGTGYFLIDKQLFKAGDVLKITIGEETYEDVLVTDCSTDSESGKIKLAVSGANFLEQKTDCKIERVVTEQTVCPPPYDNMYIDYVLGKICYYQNDFAGCNNHMSLFNSKLSDYDKWLKCHPITDFPISKIRNWW